MLSTSVCGGLLLCAVPLLAQQPAASPTERYYPFWSPDGSTIVFESNEGGRYGLWTVRAEGSDQPVALIRPSFDIQQASPSPDGSQIAFVSNRDGALDLFVMQRDGSGVRNLTRDSAVQIQPSWAPDGKSLVYSVRPAGQGRTYALHRIDLATGTTRPVLQNFDGTQMSASMHPTGNRIAFASSGVVHLVNPDGSGLTRLSLPASSGNARFSTAGRLAFHATTDGKSDIWVAAADGSDPRRLTTAPGDEQMPAWSPDGRKLAFVSRHDGRYSIHVINADGTGERCVAGCARP